MTDDFTGADAIIGALADGGIDLCFANPGTSEMHLVAALARDVRIRTVLCLFEGVATGAADGFARIAGRPAMTLLHLGPGYSNGAANIHNARRAFSPMINLVGDHTTIHRSSDAPLTSDIAALARTSSVHVAELTSGQCPGTVVQDLLAKAGGAPPGPVTLIVPADCAWNPAVRRSQHAATPPGGQPDIDWIQTVCAELLQAENPALLLGGHATGSAAALSAAHRLSASGVKIYADTFLSRHRRGGDIFAPDRLPYYAEDAAALLAGHDLLLLAGTTSPVAFFAYPGQSATLIPDTCRVLSLCAHGHTVLAWLAMLASHFGPAPGTGPGRTAGMRPIGAGLLTLSSIGQSLERHMQKDSIVSDDAVTASGSLYQATALAAEHDWLSLTGGAIGQGLPVAIGAAMARPNARVVALTGDGAAMFNPQSLWTMARERLDITIVVVANRAYKILQHEYRRTGCGNPATPTQELFSLDCPAIDWVAMAGAQGVSARSCTDTLAFDRALADALTSPGPYLIEAIIE